MSGRLLLLLLLSSFLCYAQEPALDERGKRPLMRIHDNPFPDVKLEVVPFETTTIQVPCKQSWVANWCLRCYNPYCKKHCEDCGLEWGTRTLRCFQYGIRIADVRHACLLLESKATERMMGDKDGATWESMAFECRVCESRIENYSHAVNLDLLNTRPDPIPDWSNEETKRKHIRY